VLNTTGDPAAARTAVRYLAAPGVVVGTVTTREATPSAIEYPAAARDQAMAFATAAGATALLTTATVPHITVVLGPTGLKTLLAALRTFPGLPAPACG
jgi:hypothetical protein